MTEIMRDITNLPLPWFILPVVWLIMMAHMTVKVAQSQPQLRAAHVTVVNIDTGTREAEDEKSEAEAWGEVHKILKQIEERKKEESRTSE